MEAVISGPSPLIVAIVATPPDERRPVTGWRRAERRDRTAARRRLALAAPRRRGPRRPRHRPRPGLGARSSGGSARSRGAIGADIRDRAAVPWRADRLHPRLQGMAFGAHPDR